MANCKDGQKGAIHKTIPDTFREYGNYSQSLLHALLCMLTVLLYARWKQLSHSKRCKVGLKKYYILFLFHTCFWPTIKTHYKNSRGGAKGYSAWILLACVTCISVMIYSMVSSDVSAHPSNCTWCCIFSQQTTWKFTASQKNKKDM